MKKFLPFGAMLVLVAFLAGCGVKPHHVDPPVGGGTDNFPRTYPAPDTP